MGYYVAIKNVLDPDSKMQNNPQNKNPVSTYSIWSSPTDL